MFNLIKKDYLIVKKVWLCLIFVSLLIPIFLSFAGSDTIIPAWLTLTTTSILIALILFSNIDEEEEKYPKALALITTIGYTRNTQVTKRFVLMIFVFIYITIIYLVESYFIANLGKISIMSFVISLLGFTIIASLYLSLTTIFGVRAGRYIVMLVIMLISLGPTILSKLDIRINIEPIYKLNKNILILSMIVSAIAIYLIALKISIISYNNKDL